MCPPPPSAKARREKHKRAATHSPLIPKPFHTLIIRFVMLCFLPIRNGGAKDAHNKQSLLAFINPSFIVFLYAFLCFDWSMKMYKWEKKDFKLTPFPLIQPHLKLLTIVYFFILHLLSIKNGRRKGKHCRLITSFSIVSSPYNAVSVM